ncbi:hypothetical protein Tco_0705204 [Tanacetum coccineum]|uniref:Uncharacterized protein n=1 Tax=Tanacetum coccineum TaxID=301880 RepID=A0ABQ4Y5X9_9ASTR
MRHSNNKPLQECRNSPTGLTLCETRRKEAGMGDLCPSAPVNHFTTTMPRVLKNSQQVQAKGKSKREWLLLECGGYKARTFQERLKKRECNTGNPDSNASRLLWREEIHCCDHYPFLMAQEYIGKEELDLYAQKYPPKNERDDN